MSLVGSLEELGLGDILQIVSLSRKSGILTLISGDKVGKIVFCAGEVIKASSNVLQENLGTLLMREGALDCVRLHQALELQRQDSTASRLGDVLAAEFAVPPEVVEKVAREQAENIVYSFFGWEGGSFTFEMKEPEEPGTTRFSPLQFMLDQGLNPQWLALEARRLTQERQRDDRVGREAVEDERPPERVETADPKGAGDGDVVVVDDNEGFRHELARALQQRGRTVQAFSSGADALRALKDSWDRGQRPFLVTDLIMPKMDGSGILGGLELANAVRACDADYPVVILSDLHNPEAERRVAASGLPEVLHKPESAFAGKASAEPDRFYAELEARLTDTGLCRSPEREFFDLRRELSPAMIQAWEELAGEDFAGGSSFIGLKGVLQELQQSPGGSSVILLSLRYACEFFNRCVLLARRGGEFIVCGQFGFDTPSALGGMNTGRISVRQDTDAAVGRVLASRMAKKFFPSDEKRDFSLWRQLGGRGEGEFFLGPIVCDGQTRVLLYGDNLPGKVSLGDTGSLEIFLTQAGLALEREVLRRRLHSRDTV